VDHRILVCWTCRPCEVEGQDAPGDGGEIPTCWYCGGPVVVTARPTVRSASGPNHPEAARTGGGPQSDEPAAA
jgi:hypothetical protein